MSLGKRIAELRLKRGINKSELATILNISHVQVIRYERDESTPSMKKLKQMAEYFSVSTDYLLQGKAWKTTGENEMDKKLDRYYQLPNKYKKQVVEFLDLIYHKYSTSK